MNQNRNFVRILGAAATALLLAAIPARSADYHVYGGIYAGDPVPEGISVPPNPLPTFLTADEIVGEEELYATGVLAMVRVDLIAASSNAVLASTVGLLGAYYASFSDPAATTTVRFALYDAATGDKLHETEPVQVAAGSNRRYLLAPISPAEAGGASLIPHPAGTAAYAFTRVGLSEVADIGSDGLADCVGAAPQWRNAPFGRSLRVFGAASLGFYPLVGAGQFCYKVKATPPGGGAPFYLDDPLYKRKYVVDTSTSPPTVTSTREKVGPHNEPGITGCYRFTPMAEAPLGGSTVFWSFPDQLVNWNTRDEANGLHQLELEVYRRSDGLNQGAAGAALDLHLDNRAVALSFDRIEQQSSTGALQVDLLANPCDIVHLTGGRRFFVEYTAHHPGGYLASYSLRAVSNAGPSASLASGAYDPSGMPPAGFSGPSPDSVTALSADLSGTCAYAIWLNAWARTTNGYGRLFRPHRLKTYYIQTSPRRHPSRLSSSGRR